MGLLQDGTRERRTAAATSSWLSAAQDCILLRCLACLKAVALGLLAMQCEETKTASALRLTACEALFLAGDLACAGLLACILKAARLPTLAG